MDDHIKVAGVTFDNPDGESRQTILRKLGFGYRYAILKQTTFDGERAVEVRISGKLIGYVPKTQLGNPLSHEEELTALVSCYSKGDGKDKYYVTLSAREVPTSKEYAYMKKCCLAAKKPMPAYDKRAYAQYWAVVKA